MKKVVIRADASQTIGHGHIMRCLTLAKNLKKVDVDVHFICRDLSGNLIEKIKQDGFKTHLINNKPQAPQQEDIPFLLTLMQEIKPDWLIIDHYEIDEEWENTFKPIVGKILVIDDLANRRHYCDMLLDQTFGITKDIYKDLTPVDCKILVGVEYALIRNEFISERKKVSSAGRSKEKIENILICFGGIDKYNASQTALSACERLFPSNPLNIRLIINQNNPNIDTLKTAVENSSQNVELIISPLSMAKEMSWADLSIGAGGTMSWERCMVGLPALVVSVASNQNDIITALDKIGVIINAGKVNSVTDKDIAQLLHDCITSKTMMTDMSKKAFEICDGLGSQKISEKLLTF